MSTRSGPTSSPGFEMRKAAKLTPVKLQNVYDKTVSELQQRLGQQNDPIDRMRRQAGGSSKDAPDEFWRELVESHAFVQEFKRDGLTLKDISERVKEGTILKDSGIKAEEAKRNADIVASGRDVKPDAPIPGHQWPPIIKLSEADGYSFASGRQSSIRDSGASYWMEHLRRSRRSSASTTST